MSAKGKLLLVFLILIIGGLAAYGSYQAGYKNQINKISQNNTENMDQRIEETLTDNTSNTSTTEDFNASSSDTIDSDIPTNTVPGIEKRIIHLGFAGDVNFDENSMPVKTLEKKKGDLDSCFSTDLLSLMQDVDIMMLNNEFCYSTRGKKIEGKSYTHRADPSRVHLLTKMGVDIVSLANNHALDFGTDALLDTFDTLDSVQIPYVGAGKDLERAMEPIYFTEGDTTIGYVSGSRVVYDVSWYATESRAGMLATYDPANLIASIKEAKANSDYVVVFVHWGIERKEYPVEYQRTLAKQYIDAGADVIIGAHPHVIQGIEYYKGKPIVYSLGNYWFASYAVKSAFAEIILEDGNATLKLYPVYTESCYTYITDDKKKAADYYSYVESISDNVSISEDGIVTEKRSQ